jgi:hypothetical protein
MLTKVTHYTGAYMYMYISFDIKEKIITVRHQPFSEQISSMAGQIASSQDILASRRLYSASLY